LVVRNTVEAVLNTMNFDDLVADAGLIAAGALKRQASASTDTLEESIRHLSFLAEALRASSYVLFRDYIAWAKILEEHAGHASMTLEVTLRCLAGTLRTLYAGVLRDQAIEYLEQAAQEMKMLPSASKSFLLSGNRLDPLAQAYFADLQAGDRRTASERILRSVAEGTAVADIYRHVFEPAQKELGRLWQMNRMSVAQEHFCTAATQMIMCQLYPNILSGAKNGKVFVGASIAGELHEIGIRMVTDFFEMAGWDTHFLGANTPTGSFLDHLETVGADVTGISATITPHVDLVRQFIQQLRSRPSLKKVRVLVGGYPFNQDAGLWKSLGADGFASNADDAIAWAGKLLDLES